MSKETEYRIVKINNLYYLQFKYVSQVIDFPKFWKTKEKVLWKYIPNDQQYFNCYCSVSDCPTDLQNFVYDESNLHMRGTESELEDFINDFPNIESYLDEQNFKRAIHMDRLRTGYYKN